MKKNMERRSGLPEFFRRDGRNLLYLTLISAVLFIAPLFFLDLPGGDETRVAGISAEMLLDGDWITPRLNGTPFLEYPPLCYAAVAACFRLLGFTPFAAKLPLALSALAGVLIFYSTMRVLRYSKRVAFAGSFMLATAATYLGRAYDCRADMMLTAFCILAWFGFAVMEFSSGPSAARRFIGMILTAAGIAGGIMTKNLPGMAIPLSGIGCTVLFGDLMNRRFSFGVYCRLAGAALLGLVPYAVYLLLLYDADGMEAVEEVLVFNNFGRFSGGQSGDHSEPFWFYLQRLPGQFQPWLPFLLAGLILRFRALWRHPSGRNLLPLSLLLIPFLLLSAAGGKRQVYLLPLSAPAALIAASSLPYLSWLVRRFLRRERIVMARRSTGFLLAAATLLIALGMGGYTWHVSRNDSFAPAFAEAERLCHAVPGRRLVLVRARERLKGAAFFYCRTMIPEFASCIELNPNDIALTYLDSDAPLPAMPPDFTARRFTDSGLVLFFAEHPQDVSE